MNPKFLVVFLFTILLSSLWWTYKPQIMNFVSQKPAKVKTISPINSDRKVYLGIWTKDFRDTERRVVVPEALDHFEQKTNRKFAIAHFYRGWEFLTDYTFVNDLELIHQNNWTPMVSVSPYAFEDCGGKSKINIYKKIASGECDEFLHQAGNNLSRIEKPFFFRFAWEMNVDTIDWSVQKFEDTPQDYVLAWQRMHTIFKEEGANQLVWVFSPNIIISKSIPYKDLYPGDQYVDWIGLDGYNWGTTKSWSNWQDFNQVFRKSYEELTTIAPTKQLMIAEVNSANLGGDKAAWYKDMLEVQIPNKYPKVNAVVLFDEDKTNQEGVNWLIDVTPESLEAFKKGIQNPLYQSTMPNDFKSKLN